MTSEVIKSIVSFIKSLYPAQDFIPLHAPLFIRNERKYVLDAIDSTYVSSVGEYVNKFEAVVCQITGAKYCTAIVNGTSALHMALLLADVKSNDEVLSQSLTFIATCNAISYLGAKPIFVDVDNDSLGMSPNALLYYLENNTEKRLTGLPTISILKSASKLVYLCILSDFQCT